MAAMICSVIVNSLQAFAGGNKEGRKSFSPSDFLPDWAGERPAVEASPAQSVEEMKAQFMQIAGSANAKAKTKQSKAVPMKKRKVASK